jgi:cytochrome P450
MVRSVTDLAQGDAGGSARLLAESDHARAAEIERRHPEHRGAVRLYGPDFHADPRALYRRLRSDWGDVAPVLLDDDVPAWLVLGYREVHYVTGNPDQFSKDSRTWNAWDLVPPNWPLRPPISWRDTILWLDGDVHAGRSAAVEDALAAIDPFDLAARCERMADQLIDGFAADGHADLISQYSTIMPMVVGTTLLNLPHDEVEGFVADLASILNFVGDFQGANERLHANVRERMEARRRAPGKDPLSRLAAHPAGLSNDDVYNDLLTLFIMGQTKLAGWIGNTLRLLLTDNRFATGLAGGRRSVNQALNEVLWEDPPHPNAFGRWATRQVDLGGRRVRQGDLLLLSIAATNDDPRVRPEAVDRLGRGNAHLSFGSGPHRCPYAAQDVSEVVARTAIEVLLDRLPDLDLAVPAEDLFWVPVIFLRTLAALPVTFTPR